MLRTAGMGPVPERSLSWRTFLTAHWGAIAAADFFTTEVWTARGLVTYYTLFVIELASRRVHLVGSTPHPDDAFMCQVARVLMAADDGILRGHRILICDRDTKWSATICQTLADGGVRVVQTPSGAQLQCPRGAIRPVHQGGMLESDHRAGGRALAPGAHRVHGALPPGTESPGPGRSADCAGPARAPGCDRSHPLPGAARRAPSLLSSSRMMGRSNFRIVRDGRFTPLMHRLSRIRSLGLRRA